MPLLKHVQAPEQCLYNYFGGQACDVAGPVVKLAISLGSPFECCPEYLEYPETTGMTNPKTLIATINPKP